MEIYMLLDRTGSMSGLWEEAVTSVNAYVHELKMDGTPDNVTLAVFDFHGGMKFDVIRDSVPIKEWKDMGTGEVMPRGSTPLYDAIGRLVSMAEEKGSERTCFVVMTDGYENASKEMDRKSTKAALERVDKKNWQVSFLGADFDNFAQAQGLGVAAGQAMNFSRGRGTDSMRATAEVHRNYRMRGSRQSFTEQNRRDSGEDEVKQAERSPRKTG
jgi:uncharacterized protein YegL